MLDGTRQYPRIIEGVKLVHPEGTDQYFIYKSATGERFELNEVSFEMLSLMDGSRDTEEICRAIQAEFEGADTAQEDLEDLIKEVTAEGYLKYTNNCSRG